jgi:CheY-like chemotaxis protein
MPSILVIDDDPVTCTLIKAIFRHVAVEVWTVGNGEVGLEMARTQSPDLIVMDLVLPPPMDGLATTRAIKSDLHLRHIPVVAITAADAGFGDEQRAYEAGCDGYVLKPFETKSFREYLSQFLNLA